MVVKAKATKELKNNGKIIGYHLLDTTGSEVDAKAEAIIDAINKGIVSISNLKVVGSSLVMVEEQTQQIQPKPVVQAPVVKPVVQPNKVGKAPEVTPTVIKANNTSIIPDKPLVMPSVTSAPVEQSTANLDNPTENRVKATGELQSSKERMQELVNRINEATKVYEQGKDEIMDNFTWDKLYDELLSLEQSTGIILPGSPTQEVGYEVVSNLPKEKHTTKMLSLAKTKDRDELASFLGDKEGVLSWKLDGLTVVMTYKDGNLEKAVTRGNGEIGEVVTPNAKHFKNLPRHINFSGTLVLRGEATISYSTFERINASLGATEEKYKNPRNLCSGSVRQLDSKVTASRGVEWRCFEVVECIGGDLPNEYDAQLKVAKALGFDVVDYMVVNAGNIQQAIEQFESKLRSEPKYDVPTDGLVLTYRDRQYGMSLGTTSKTPRHSKAFKWQDEEAVTTLRDIEWQTGRTGVITPVAIFDPVDIEGSTVSRASVHNVSIMNELGLGIGDKIKVYKANMIIPQISENLTCSGDCEIPDTCPCCGGPTEIHQDPVSGVLTLYCTDPDCPAKGSRLLKHFVSRDAMNIDGISGATLDRLVDEGIVDGFASIYHIKDHGDYIVNMAGFGYQSFLNMVEAIEKSRTVKTANLIYALGIPNVGLSTAKLISKHFNNNILDAVTATYSDLIEIEGIGDVIADSFVDYFSDEENAQNFIDLHKELNVVQDSVSTNTSMSGVTICVTGDVYMFSNRRVIKDLVESLGGKLTGSVSRSTSYLVTNDTTSGSRKNKAAKEYGIPILSEQEFIDKFNLSDYVE